MSKTDKKMKRTKVKDLWQIEIRRRMPFSVYNWCQRMNEEGKRFVNTKGKQKEQKKRKGRGKR
jgi:hypothetical protein